jgi:hypothetical protein
MVDTLGNLKFQHVLRKGCVVLCTTKTNEELKKKISAFPRGKGNEYASKLGSNTRNPLLF